MKKTEFNKDSVYEFNICNHINDDKIFKIEIPGSYDELGLIVFKYLIMELEKGEYVEVVELDENLKEIGFVGNFKTKEDYELIFGKISVDSKYNFSGETLNIKKIINEYTPLDFMHLNFSIDTDGNLIDDNDNTDDTTDK